MPLERLPELIILVAVRSLFESSEYVQLTVVLRGDVPTQVGIGL